ncbi:hypothetical protein DN752_16030 [Echinicola strongylocentroti]|uniref:Uncharacterized protein n=1 Tax=Echinicola strongylocentroti TaxID=1795355 RepID=A0A2Z4IK63_9BACT|nr:hypothetical protein [Echinicola strongylocentroti]AWW31511.1 hypothetical protein DN752_16030 [Echinicola strongylocentroti]
MLKRLLVILLVIVIGLAGYLFYTSRAFTGEVDAIELVSDDAVFVFETKEPVKAWNQLVSQPIWKRLSAVPSLKDVENQLVVLDSLTGRAGKLESTLSGNKFIVSVHPTAKSEFDFLFLVAFEDKGQDQFIQSIRDKVAPGQIKSRNHSGETIYEYKNPDRNSTLSYTVLENVVVASYNSFLIEEAIRYIQSDNLKSFKDTYKELYASQNEAKDGLGLFRVGSAGLASFMNGVAQEDNLEFPNNFAQHRLSANLELKFAENKIFLDGFTFYRDGEKVDFANDKQGGGNLFSNYISNRTAVYFQYNVNGTEQIERIANPAFRPKNTLMGEVEKNLKGKGFMENLSGEVGYMVLEKLPNADTDKVLIIKAVDPQKSLDLLKQFSLTLSQGDSSKLLSDHYKEQELFLINQPEFPAHLFNGQFLGFPHTFVTLYKDMLVMGNTVKAIKVFVDDIYNDNTWGRSLNQRRFLEGISKNAGFNFIVNIPRFWNSLLETSSPRWGGLFQKYAPQLKSIDLVALQLSEIGDEQYVNLELGYNLNPIKSVKDILLTESMGLQFAEPLTYGPKTLENFNDKSTDFIVQDATGKIHFFNDEGERIFSKEVTGNIKSDIYQIDYYKNGKLQLVFATDSMIYAFDRLGSPLPAYPIRLPRGTAIEQMSLVDYNNTKDYRYFTATTSGDLYIFDKKGNNLEGWTPRSTSGVLAVSPQHHRLSGVGDYMLALNRNGELYIMNRRGELQTGAPINLGEGVASDYALIQHGDRGDTQLVTVTAEGEVIRVNFRGELTYRNQLLRPDKNTRFSLVKDQMGDRYYFVVQEYNKITVMDSDLNTVFEKNMVSDDLDFQFFSFGGDKNIFVVIDRVQEFIFLYNLEGELLNTRPLNGKHQVEIKYSGSKNEYTIYAVHQNQFSAYKLPL